jgi:hypothetical protein
MDATYLRAAVTPGYAVVSTCGKMLGTLDTCQIQGRYTCCFHHMSHPSRPSVRGQKSQTEREEPGAVQKTAW